MKMNLLFSLLIFMFTNCNSTKNIQDSAVTSVSLHHISEARNAKLTLLSSHYVMENHGESFQYDLSADQWAELNEILGKVSIEELSNYAAPEVSGRLVEKELTSQILIKTKEGEFTSQSFINGNVPGELRELFEFLNSFFPLQ